MIINPVTITNRQGIHFSANQKLLLHHQQNDDDEPQCELTCPRVED